MQILLQFLLVEEAFDSERTFEEATLALASKHKDDLAVAAAFAQSHCKVGVKLELVMRVLDHVEKRAMVEVPIIHEQVRVHSPL